MTINSDHLPPQLRENFLTAWQQWNDQAADITLHAQTLAQLPRVWACSDFVSQTCLRYPALLQDLQDSGDLFRGMDSREYAQQLTQILNSVTDEPGLKQALRQFRQREMVRILWRDFSNQAELAETLRDLSGLAEACIDQSLQLLYRWQCQSLGTPMNNKQQPQQLVVLGMGKLGGGELNVSSDVDLIFAYPEEGQTQGGARVQDNFEFFLRLGQRLIQVLNQTTEDGFVFRVDTRLRPFGDSGPLALSFDGMENYYQIHGREWERYALIKARVVGGDYAAGEELLQRLRPFVYRRYLDFGSYESLRELKIMIAKEVSRKGMEHNVKLGAGGIREIEFIGQVFQLIRGGQDRRLQQRQLFPVLDHLQASALLPEFVVSQLKNAYIFLRNTEHRIQGYADQQTHNLPQDEPGQQRLAFAMGFNDWPSFSLALTQFRTQVHEHFEQVFAAPQSAVTHTALDEQVTLLWSTATLEDREAALTIVHKLGFADSAGVLQRLQSLHSGRAYLTASARGQSRLDRILPLLIGATLQQESPDVALARSLEVIEAILRRTAYLALLEEHPMALSQLVKLCAASPWITNYLATHPILLDELLDPRNLYTPAPRDLLASQLDQRLADVDPADEERILDTLRHFKHAQVLRVAAADIGDALPVMKVSDHLTWIAEVVLVQALRLAWEHMVAKHGCPPDTQSDGASMGFAIVGYGKLAGLELGYGSDLDLVFIYRAKAVDAHTSGDKPVAIPVFYARLTQRLLHILTTLTPAGVLYDVDVRLRPDGASGLLVTTIQAFEEYQSNKAWTWEHQALARARVVAGDAALAEEFSRIRAHVLARARDRAGLLQEVREMRLKMRENLDKTQPGEFDLKQSPGGIVDIEFMVQYAILAWAHQYPDLVRFTDNIRQLEGLAASGVMTQADADFLSDAYRAYRTRQHRLKLQALPAVVAADAMTDWRDGIIQRWNNLMTGT